MHESTPEEARLIICRDVERRRKNRERMAKARAASAQFGICREVGCNRPVAKSKRTGKPAKQCTEHLASERLRKTPQELPWLSDADLLAMDYPGGVFDFRKPYPLKWLDALGRPIPLPRGPYVLRWL